MVKKFFKTIVRLILIIFLSSFLLIGVLRNSHVQALLAKSTSTFLSSKLGVKVWIDKVYITSYFRILLENVNIYDHKDQPMITAKSIQADMDIFQPYLSEIPINYVIIDSAFVNLRQYKGDDALNITKLFVKPTPSINDTIVSHTQSNPFILSLKHLSLKQSRFIFHVEQDSAYEVEGMDYQFLDVEGISMELEDVYVYNDSISGYVRKLQGKDRCGVVLKDVETYANVGPRNLILKDARLLTDRSNAEFDLAFHYDSWSAYLDFIDKVVIDADVHSAKINMEDIAYFASALFGMDNTIRVQGQVKGPVRNMKGRNMRISYGRSTSFHGDLQMSGLPNVYETFLNLKLKDFSTSIADLEKFKLPDGKQFDNIPDVLEKFGRVRVKGRFTGFYNDFVSETDLYTEMGMLNTDIQFMNNTEDSIIHYKGNFKARNFNLGTFTKMESEFGDINFDLQVMGKGLELESLDTKVIGQIQNLDFKNNELNTIYIDATIKENEFLGVLEIDDDLIKTNFVGNISFDSLDPYFDFVANLQGVKLAKLGLLPIDSSASLSTRVHMNFTGSQLDSIIGEINIDSTSFFYAGETYIMDSLHILSSRLSDSSFEKTLSISSDFLNGKIKGKYSLLQLPEAVELFSQQFINDIEFVDNSDAKLQFQTIDFDFNIANTETLTQLFIPSLIVEDSVFLKGNWNTNENILDFDAFLNRLTWNDIIYDQSSIKLRGEKGLLSSHILIKELILKEKSTEDSLRFGIDSLNFSSILFNDSLDFVIHWSNYNRSTKNSGHVDGLIDFSKEQTLSLAFDPSEMVINDSLWNIAGGSAFTVDSGAYIFDSIHFFSLNQSVLLNGNISNRPDNDLLIQFNNFNISIFDILMRRYGLNLDGFLSGDIRLIDVMTDINFLADLQISDLELNGEELGRAEIKSTWNTDQSVFLNVNLEKQGNKGAYKPLYLEGFYYPKKETNQIDLDLSLHNFSINFLNPFLKEFVADLEGRATGSIQIGGTIKAPDLSGRMDLIRTQFRIKYLNTLYSLSGTLNLNNELLGFDEVIVFDTVGNRAVLRGGLTHERLRNFGVDLKVQPDNFIGLNTRKGMNELFFGSAVITGDIFIKGPFDNVFLDINATSKSGTNISIPINTTLGVSDNNFIVFVNKTDTVDKAEEKQYVPELSSFSLNMDLAITPDAKVQISLPAQLGTIDAQGRGDLNMNLSRTGNFRMSGDYRISKGLFFFQIRNLLNRKFDLNEGGTISWTGDPYNGTLGMSASYQVKTSLNSLGLEQDSSYRTRVPVDCIIGLSGPIMNPNVKFNFEFPNATEEVKQYVYTKIDTTNPSEMSQQMLSLLVLNSFSFNSANDNGNIANSVGGSSLQIVANQLSNWLSQISKDVDIGINYRPGGDLTNEEVEVALSTQLFDERVTIDGNFGYQNVQDNPTSNTSSIVGDINVEVKITKDGRLRLKAFNRTNTVDLMDNTSPYTQGVGIFYRKEFNTVKDLFTSKKKKEKQQEEIQKQNMKAVKNEDLSEKSDL